MMGPFSCVCVYAGQHNVRLFNFVCLLFCSLHIVGRSFCCCCVFFFLVLLVFRCDPTFVLAAFCILKCEPRVLGQQNYFHFGSFQGQTMRNLFGDRQPDRIYNLYIYRIFVCAMCNVQCADSFISTYEK